MNYKRLWNKLQLRLVQDDTLKVKEVLELMKMFEYMENDNKDKSIVKDNGLFEQSQETGNYNPKPF